jgi:hypothetical protein
MKSLTTALVLLMALSLSSCFEIIEQISLNANGSGNFVWTANCSRSKENLNTLFSQDSVMGRKMPSTTDINTRLDEAKRILSASPGISNVQITKDFTNYIFTINMSFTSVAALDKALASTVQAVAKPTSTVPTGNFSFIGKTFSRKLMSNVQTEMGKINKDLMDMMSKSYYTSIYKFAGNIKSTSNPNAKISPSKTSMMQKVSILQIYSSKANFENTIVLE